VDITDGDIPEGVDQTAAEVIAQGEVADVAIEWVCAVLYGDPLAAWALLDDAHRLAVTQAILYANADNPAVSAFDRDELAHTLSQPGYMEHPLWAAFFDAVLAELRRTFEGWSAENIGFWSRPRPISVGLELVVLGQGGEVRALSRDEGPGIVPVLMRWSNRGWLVARVGADTLPVPGWPPAFPDGVSVYRIDET